MSRVEIEFLPKFRDLILEGKKDMTSRYHKKGNVGDVFNAFGEDFMITDVFEITLGDLSSQYYEREGYGSREEFIADWWSMHPNEVHEFGPTVYAHVFAFIVHVQNDYGQTDIIMRKIKQSIFEKDRVRLEKIHVSDILYPRFAVLKRKYGGVYYDDRLSLLFIVGEGHHLILERAFGAKEEIVEWEGVVATIDAVLDGAVCEVKTTRVTNIYTPDKLPRDYILQHRCYCAMKYPDEDVHEGRIFVLYLMPIGNGSSDPAFVSYKVKHVGLGITRSEIITVRDEISDCLAGKLAFRNVRRCPRWRCPTCVLGKECKKEAGDSVVHVDSIPWGRGG